MHYATLIYSSLNIYPLVCLHGQATFGEYPWNAVVLTKTDDYVGGGALISSQWVLTAAHKINTAKLVPPLVSIQLGLPFTMCLLLILMSCLLLMSFANVICTSFLLSVFATLCVLFFHHMIFVLFAPFISLLFLSLFIN